MVPEDWKVKQLADVCRKQISYGIVQTGEHQPNGIPCLRVVDLTKDEIQLEGMIRTTVEIHEAYRKTILEKDEIVMALRGEVGLVRLVDDKLVGANITRGLARISAKPHLVSPEFLLWELRSPKFRADLMRRVGGSALQEISLSELRKVQTLIPPLTEQKKIAQILSTWDKAITTTEQLLANSQKKKKALMQQLLTGKKRFGHQLGSYEFKNTRYGKIPADWSYPAIKEISSNVSEKNAQGTDLPVLSCSKYDGFVDSLKYFKKKVYSEDTSGYRVIPRGCFGFPSNHIEEGSIGLQNLYDFGLVSPIYVVFKVNSRKVDAKFLYSLLKTEHYRQIFSAATNASVDRRGSLRWKEFSAIHVPLPPLEEQQKIAAVLSMADSQIAVFQQKLDALKQEKKALMQQLLTGKRRVTINEKEVA
ncbi:MULTISPECIES: restriction endonuclease subunit S [unclassified Shewanella]|uniref:restriction endonuclease subunit S n=1 Tax=unclassified Shewanella TaxID=196818 RepID=UPI0021D96D46|nr:MULTISPECIES: restriction endonuclease subunit S [unclassified Shewanella]MCU8043934.1 restriction endonuclease subunit S [Shewanella sp. SM68]MCU8048102.1 restriction endonuclease subunit S [Shewanella sp. SM65]